MNDQQQILKLFEDGDRALVSAGELELRRIYAEDYVQYDESGQASGREDLIRKLSSGTLRFISMTSTKRTIRILRDGVAVVHGSEVDEVVMGGDRRLVRYVYTDVVEKRGEGWQIVASQLAKPTVPPTQPSEDDFANGSR
jgi:Domain of unknown function (DUF4440)